MSDKDYKYIKHPISTIGDLADMLAKYPRDWEVAIENDGQSRYGECPTSPSTIEVTRKCLTTYQPYWEGYETLVIFDGDNTWLDPNQFN